jgi:large subunit ribosomal protein L19
MAWVWKELPVTLTETGQDEVVRKGKVRRAKINYLRGRVGKRAKIKEIR